MFIPHSQKKLSRFSIPLWSIKFMFVLFACVFLTVSYYTYDYVQTLAENDRLVQVDAINKMQAEKIDDLVERTKCMEEKMKELNKLDEQVREMVGLEPNEENSIESDTKNEQIVLQNYEQKRENQVRIVSYTTPGILARGGSARNINIDIDENNITDEYSKLDVLDNVDEHLSNLDMEALDENQKLSELKVDVEERLKFLAAKPTRWPIYGRITSRFGYRNNPFGSGSEFHNGLDIATAYGTPIRAAGDGKIIFAGYKYGYGYIVSISHGYGYVSHYAHDSKIAVKVGEWVKKGQTVAYLGNTGRSTGPHLHFQIDYKGNPIDPLKVLD